MQQYELKRWGVLLGVLSQINDVEYQVVTQGTHPARFIPDELLEEWYVAFRSGQGLQKVGVSDEMLSILLNFDVGLDELVDYLPEEEDTVDKLFYIRNDEVWQAIREMADQTLSHIAFQGFDDMVVFSDN